MGFDQLVNSSIDFIGLLLPLFIPVALAYVLFNLWVDYARNKFLANQKYSLIRIVPPKEVLKTPAAMELFIGALYQTGGEATPVDVYWNGKSRAWFSLEIASTNGEVGFYIWTRSSLKTYIENQIYAQYPGIEVTEVEDYVDQVDYESGKYSMFGLEYKLTEKNPYPIKTYVDYGLDKHNEEEEKVDPISATTEFLGSLKAGEHAWIQIIVKAHKKEDKDPTKWFGKQDNWIEDAKKEIAEIRKDSFYKDPDDPEAKASPMQTHAQKEKIDAIERNISKPGFDVGIRAIYIAEKESFEGTNIPGLIGSFKQYGSANLNGFKPAVTTSVKYSWQDPFGKRVAKMKSAMFADYKKRIYFGTFFGPKQREKFVLNTEELATIFHFPGGSTSTPTLTRVKSRKGEAPSNLPIK
jgi:hypothetical protein